MSYAASCLAVSCDWSDYDLSGSGLSSGWLWLVKLRSGRLASNILICILFSKDNRHHDLRRLNSHSYNVKIFESWYKDSLQASWLQQHYCRFAITYHIISINYTVIRWPSDSTYFFVNLKIRDIIFRTMTTITSSLTVAFHQRDIPLSAAATCYYLRCVTVFELATVKTTVW